MRSLFKRCRNEWMEINMMDLSGFYYEFQPGDGTRYCIHCVNDVHGGILVITNVGATYRYYRGDRLKWLHGVENEWTKKAVFEFLENKLYVI